MRLVTDLIIGAVKASLAAAAPAKFVPVSFPPVYLADGAGVGLILRTLDYFRAAGRPYDGRMSDALQLLLNKRREDGAWPLQAKQPGQVHFDMEKPGRPSRWNTLRTLHVIEHFANGPGVTPL
ncbi:MAG: hypothetical protein AB1767_00025 [Bacillota bacterium]